MSREYAEAQIKELLKQTKGNPTKTRQMIIAHCMEDARLLQGLAMPHMTGIAAHAINRVISRLEKEDEPDFVPPEMPEVLNLEADVFGKELMQALSGSQQNFGDEVYVPPQDTKNRKQASQAHIDAINKIAKEKREKD